jgi:hypothetical protein
LHADRSAARPDLPLGGAIFARFVSSTLSPHNAAHIYRRRSFIARHTPFTAYESSTHKPHITISITIIALFIVELVDAAGLLLVAPPRACSAAVARHHHGYGAYMAPPPST